MGAQFVDRFVEVDGVTTRYWAEGTGSPVVLVHGFGASVEIWSAVITALAPRHRVFALDLLGAGRTGKPKTAALGPRDLADFVLSFMDALGIDRAALVGHSMGGGVALELTLGRPERVHPLVLIATTGLGRDLMPSLRLATLPVLGRLMTRPTPSIAGNFLRKCVCDESVVTDELVGGFAEMGRLPGSQDAMLRQLRTAATAGGWRQAIYEPVVERLPSVETPTLLVWGRQDRIVPFAHSQVALSRIPNARLHAFDPCGHLVQLERPGEFEAVLLQFLDEVKVTGR